jgi:membrane-associated protein
VEALFEFIQQNIAYAPWLIFFLLCLAGFNIPISEDGMLFVAGVLASQYPNWAIPLFIAVFLGAYVSDLIAYWLGYRFGNHLFEIPFFAKFIKKEKINKIKVFYVRYGIVTLIVGRFIPFGVRNALFMTAGLAHMNRAVFLIVDFVTCLLSTSIYFTLYYRYGEDVIELTRRFGVVIFGVVALLLGIYLIKRTAQKNQQIPS